MEANMHKKAKRKIVWMTVLLSLLVFISWDIVNTGKQKQVEFIHPALLGAVTATLNNNSIVGIATSEDSILGELAAPIDSILTYEQVDSITRLAIQRAGGLADIIQPGDWVVIKPNIVTFYGWGDWRKGQDTDLRVVKSIIQQLVEEGDASHITVAEGGVWRKIDDPLHPSSQTTDGWKVHWPHYGNLSYEDMIAEFDSLYPDIVFDIVDLNYYDYTPNVPVPGGGLAMNTYAIPNTILNCDRLISIATMKTHHRTGVTLTHKNYVGISPASVYGAGGWSHWGVPHDKIERVICDLFSYHPADFGVIECFWGTEGYGPQWGIPIKRNIVLASKDPVAVDAVGAYVMGFNPWDIDHLHWSHNKGYGNNDLNLIKINGPALTDIRYDFIKAKHEDTRYNFNLDFYYGRGNRTWLINGKYSGTDLDYDYLDGQESIIAPTEGDTTSGNVWTKFTEIDDYIDLRKYWNYDATNCITYAFTKIISDSAKTAYLRFGSDDGIKVWFNGEVVYNNPNTGSFWLVENADPANGNYGTAVNFVKGENRLLVKIKNTWGDYGFSMCVCEPNGDTPFWIGYHIDLLTSVSEESDTNPKLKGYQLLQNCPNPFNQSTEIRYSCPASVSIKNKSSDTKHGHVHVSLKVYDLSGRVVRTLVDELQNPGYHRVVWDGKDDQNSSLPNSIYFYRIKLDNFVKTKKMILLR